MIERTSVRDRNPSVFVKYVHGGAPSGLKLYTFDEKDDPNIKDGSAPFLLTCSRSAYPDLRLYLARQLGAFVTRVNQGMINRPTVWNDLMFNPENATFQTILRGDGGPATELFIIPLKRDARRVWSPEGGVKFMSDTHRNMYALYTGTLNLFMGWDSIKNDSLCIDVYYGGRTDNDYISTVNSI